MRIILFTLLFSIVIKTNGQSLSIYKDSVNHFLIKIPNEWKYGQNKNYPSIKLIAYRTPSSMTDTSKDNFNLNILETLNSNLDETYSEFLKSIKNIENFKLLDFGDSVINGEKFKWLIETHRYSSDNIQMHNYDFVTYQNDKTYIITFTTFSNRFDIIKPTFITIANSFTLLK